MQSEVNGRVINNLILYVRKHKPQDLPRMLEGFREEEIGDQHEWVSMEVRNQLFKRAEELLERPDLLEQVGREAFSLHALGSLEWMLRMETDLYQIFRQGKKYADLFSSFSNVTIHKLLPREVLVERAEPQMIRGSCYYVRGIFMALLELFDYKHAHIRESQCAIPIWEKGVIDGNRFYLRQGSVWRVEIASGREEELGPVPSQGNFTYGGTTYGAPSCLYHVGWKGGPGWLRRWMYHFPLHRRWLEMMQKNLFLEYDLVEKRNRQLRQSTKLLQGLLKQKSDLTQTLEQKVADRTLELEDLIKQLQELDEMKSYFLTLTSHELRTPLTIIKVALSLLLSEGQHLTPEKFRHYLLMAKTNADTLKLLIDNQLDLSRLESGQMKLEVEAVDLVRLLRETAEEFRDLTDRRELDLKTDLPAVLPDVIADPVRLKQIISNLLSNAIKFTPPKGTIWMNLETAADQVLIKVADTGIGIESWEFGRIFHKFQQSERSLTREASGVGLGLAIVKELVELHEGRVWVESEKGKGARFFVQLPLAGPKDPGHFVQRKAVSGEDSHLILESR